MRWSIPAVVVFFLGCADERPAAVPAAAADRCEGALCGPLPVPSFERPTLPAPIGLPGQERRLLTEDGLSIVALGPEERWVLLRRENEIFWVGLPEGPALRLTARLRDLRSDAEAVRWTADGAHLFLLESEEGPLLDPPHLVHWDLEALARRDLGTSGAWSFAVGDDGRVLARVGRSIVHYDPRTGEKVPLAAGPGSFWGSDVPWREAGGTFAFFAEVEGDRSGELVVWREGRGTLRLGPTARFAPALSADGSAIAWIEPDESRGWAMDLETGVRRELQRPAIAPGWPMAAAFSPDGSHLAWIEDTSEYTFDGRLHLLELATGSDEPIAEASDGARWSAAGDAFVYGADRGGCGFSHSSYVCGDWYLHRLGAGPTHLGFGGDARVAFTTDGARFALLHDAAPGYRTNTDEGTLALWETATARRLGGGAMWSGAEWIGLAERMALPDGSGWIFLDDAPGWRGGRVNRWDRRTLALQTLAAHGPLPALSPDGSHLLVHDRAPSVWDWEGITDEERARIDLVAVADGAVRTLHADVDAEGRFSSDGRWVVVSGKRGDEPQPLVLHRVGGNRTLQLGAAAGEARAGTGHVVWVIEQGEDAGLYVSPLPP